MHTSQNIPQEKLSRLPVKIGGAFFQFNRKCLQELREIISKYGSEQIVVFDVMPESRMSEVKLLLSESERIRMLRQIGFQNIIPVSHLQFQDQQQNYHIHYICGLSGKSIDTSFLQNFIDTAFSDVTTFRWSSSLGYYYPLTGQVVYGNKVGRTLGFPTANLRPENSSKILPPMGVYAGWLRYDNNWHKAMINVGIRPTLDLKNVTIEAHIFDFSNKLYGEEISLHFLHRIRNEMRFPSLEDLKKQLEQDRLSSLKLLRQEKPPLSPDNFILT